MISRWDSLFDKKPVPLLEHLADEVSKLLSADLQKWPLPVMALDPGAGESFQGLVSGEVPRPAAALFEEAFKLVRWDLEHDTAAYDDYFRNQRWGERGLTAQDKPALIFVGRWLLEQMTALREATQGRVKREDLLRILERTRARLGGR